MELGLRGKRAIVTGGTRGIGRKIVELLVAEGCHVGFCARDKGQVEDCVDRLSGNAAIIRGASIDVTDDVGLQTLSLIHI